MPMRNGAGTESKNGLMAQFTKGNGKTTRLKVVVHSGMLKVMFMLATLRQIKRTEQEFILTLMDRGTKDNG